MNDLLTCWLRLGDLDDDLNLKNNFLKLEIYRTTIMLIFAFLH